MSHAGVQWGEMVDEWGVGEYGGAQWREGEGIRADGFPRAQRGALWEQGQVARFFGRHEHTLDEKGRVILPSKFRAHFEHGGYLAPEQDGCLSLWTPEQFEVQMDAMLEKAATSRSDRNLARLWASSSHPLEVDRQGRMFIPTRLREYAALDSEVLVLGAIDRVELWNRQMWDEKVLPEEARLTQGDDG